MTLTPWLHDLIDATGIPLDGLAALGLLLAGWLLALLLRRVAVTLLERAGQVLPAVALRQADLARTQRAVGRVVFWLVMTLALMGATERLGLPVLTTWFSGLASYLPRIVVAVLVMVAGLALARLAAGAAESVAAGMGVADGARLAMMTQTAVMAITGIVAVEALGVDVTFLEIALLLVLGAVLLAGALAFGSGARPLVTDILACHYVLRVYEVGQTLRCSQGEGPVVEGRLLRVMPPLVILDSPEGEISVPGSSIVFGRTTRLSGSS